MERVQHLRAFLWRQRTRQRSARRTRFRHERFPVPINRGTSYTQRPARRSQANGGSQRFHGRSHSSSAFDGRFRGIPSSSEAFFWISRIVSACLSRCRRPGVLFAQLLVLDSHRIATTTLRAPWLGQCLQRPFSPSRAAIPSGARNTAPRGAATLRSGPAPGTHLPLSEYRVCTRH